MTSKTEDRLVNNEKGEIMLSLIMLFIGLMSILMIVKTLDNSRNAAYRAVQAESRKEVLQNTKNLLANDMIVKYSLNTYNSPGSNAALKNCIMAGQPTVGGVCDNIELSFYAQKSATTAERFLGSSSNPAYVNQFGEPCDPTQTKCLFKSIAYCNFSCPDGQAACASSKIMKCDLEISPVEGTVFKTYLLSKEKNEYISQLSIQIDPSQTIYNIFRL